MKNSLICLLYFLDYLSKYLRFMYKKQANKVVRPTSVISGFKRAAGLRTAIKNKKVISNGKSENIDVEKYIDSNKHVNGKIHFNPDVPEEVQAFIRRISSEPSDIHKDQRGDPNLLDVTDMRKSRRVSLPCIESEEDITDGSMKSSVSVIVTADYSPSNLTNSDYDKLRKA